MNQHTNTSMNTNPIPVTVGLDLGDRKCHFCLLDSGGTVLQRGTVATRGPALGECFRRLQKRGASRVALEVGSHSPWISRLLSELGFEVIVANALRVSLISKNNRKNDVVDAELLARIARLDPAMLSPIQHRGPQAQADLAMLRSRGALVEARTKLINHVRGSTKPSGVRLPACSAESFHNKAAGCLPEELEVPLGAVLEQIGMLTGQIKSFDKLIGQLCKERYPETQTLMQVPGVGVMTALTFVLTLETPDRIRKNRNIGAFLGLVPRTRDSCTITPALSISKAGDRVLRTLLVNCAQYILGHFGPDTDLRRFGERLSERGGKAAKKRAVVAVARKLSVLLLRLWQTGQVYEPLRNSDKATAA